MDIRKLLSEGRPLLFDGAMGTVYSALPGCENKRCESANIYDPDSIIGIHKAYLEAGCRAIKTNTFSAGLDVARNDMETARSIIEAGCELAAKTALKYGAFVFADMGPAPLGMGISPAENYIAQSKIFLAQGLKCFLLETLPSDEGVSEFARWLKAHCADAFIIVSFAVGPHGFTRDGCSGAELFEAARNNENIDIVGFNCYSGPHHTMEFIKTLKLKDTRISVMPNAGYPTVLGKRTVYGGTPEYFAQKMEQILGLGAAIVGGCCGTTPEHIGELKKVVSDFDAKKTETSGKKQPRIHRNTENKLWDKIQSGERIIAVEYDPPANDDISAFVEGVKKLRSAGVDAVTIADCPVGVPRVDSSLLACKIKRELNVEPIPHMTCRDRNLNATKALLLGLSVEGVHNVLLVTGDPLPSETRDEVKTVFNCNSRKLARYVCSLSEDSLDTPFRVFAALNVNARNFDIQLQMAQEKEKHGVSCFMTQPVLSERALENLKQARSVLKSKIFGGIYPVVSYRNACFMNNEIAGIFVSDEICGMYKDKNREEAEELALKLSVKIAEDIKPYTDGLYIMTPFNRVGLVCRIIDEINK